MTKPLVAKSAQRNATAGKPTAGKPLVAKPLVAKLPSKQEILDFLKGASAQVGKREIARAFGVKGGDRMALKALLRDMADDGLIAGSRRKLERPGTLPPVTVVEIVARDSDGEFIARPATWPEEQGPAPKILMTDSRREAGPAAGLGDRVLAQITPQSADADYPYHARPIKRLPRAARAQLGIFRALPGRRRHRPRRPQAAEGMACCPRSHPGRREWRARPLRACRLGALRPAGSPHYRPPR